MNCCDEYGNCRQGRDCPVRTARYEVLYRCNTCGENVGYFGWLFTKLRLPLLKHKCKEQK